MSPLIRNVSIGIGGTVVAVGIYFTSIIGANYQGAILNHLTDIVNGAITNTVVATNAPNWAYGTPLATPSASSIATSSYGSAASGLASSTPYTFAIAALDGSGTTTLSSTQTITTDASTTQNKPEVINVDWSAVEGATGYAVYFATSSNAASSALSQCFFATTTGQYTFATSTGSWPCSNTFSDTHAFSNLISSFGPSYLNGSNSTATSSVAASSTALQVGGPINAEASATTTNCYAATAGDVFYNTSNSHEWGCNGSAWTKIF